MNSIDHSHNMSGMGGMSPPSTAMGGSGTTHHQKLTHMTFFWGKNSEILFSGWPGKRGGMYALALIFVFVLAILLQWLSYCKWIKPGRKNVVAGFVQTLLYGIMVGPDYLVMLALMSFNGGIFLAAWAGHTLGFLLFGSRVFKGSQEPPYLKSSDIPPNVCC